MPDTFVSKLPPQEVTDEVLNTLGKEGALHALRQMSLIRHLETRGEAAYQQGLVGGFYHAYTGQEAIQTSLIDAIGKDHWYVGFYRCHALAYLLGATPYEIMAELYGKETGNAQGRGGSMHLYTERMLGGFGIVGGQAPIACGAGFSIKYLDQKEKMAICFLGDGAVAQGAFHESLNQAALWDLPVLFVIENNQWGMGTHVSRAIAKTPIAESQAPSYGINGYTMDGMSYFECYKGFQQIYHEITSTQRPVIVEVLCERFKGHSISDPGLYRSKDDLEKVKQRDPIHQFVQAMMEKGWITEEEHKVLDKEEKQRVIEAIEKASKDQEPPISSLEEGVYAP
jgi:pyruvate dehydrogenase E1 component alpha subunit